MKRAALAIACWSWTYVGCTGLSAERAIAKDALVASSGSSARAASAQSSLLCDRVVDRFEQSSPGTFPAGWSTWDEDELDTARRSGRWVVAGTGPERHLVVRSGPDAWTIGYPIDAWDLERHPVLRWRWRVVSRAQASELRPDTADGPALGVVWLVGLPFIVRRIEYTWHWQRKRGDRFSSRFGQDQLIVLENAAPARAGAWLDARVDVRRHYASVFDSAEPPAPAGISITSPKETPGAAFEMQIADLELCRSPGP